MTNEAEKAFCAACFLLGVALPWGFLILAATLSLFVTGDYWGETAAWLAAVGVFLMAVSYLIARVLNHTLERN